MSLIMPRLHYSNATLTGLPEYRHRWLQSVLNAAVRLIYRKSPCEHTHHTCFAKATLATVQRACWLQTRRSHLPMFTWSGATLRSWWHMLRRRHQPPAPALVVIGSTDCQTNTTDNHGRAVNSRTFCRMTPLLLSHCLFSATI